jgi:nucleotide-binding universal stress UspA family protein
MQRSACHVAQIPADPFRRRRERGSSRGEPASTGWCAFIEIREVFCPIDFSDASRHRELNARRISGTGSTMRQIQQILCPIDLSEISRHTVDHAILLARWYSARIIALHVSNPIVIPSTDFTVVGIGTPIVLSDEDFAEIQKQVTACFNGGARARVDVLVDTGHPANCILERAKTLPADLIVLGTHGHGGFEHLVLGSVTEKVLRKATCPVMTVPPRARATSKLPFKRLLCPVDFSDSSLAALEFAFSLAQEGDAELTLLHVFEWEAGDEPLTNRPFNVPEYRREVERDFAARLQALVPDSVRSACRPTTRIAHGKPYREILGVATEDGADLIVMGVQGRNALDLMLFGSTTNQVVRRATCPVVTLRR